MLNYNGKVSYRHHVSCCLPSLRQYYWNCVFKKSIHFHTVENSLGTLYLQQISFYYFKQYIEHCNLFIVVVGGLPCKHLYLHDLWGRNARGTCTLVFISSSLYAFSSNVNICDSIFWCKIRTIFRDFLIINYRTQNWIGVEEETIMWRPAIFLHHEYNLQNNIFSKSRL